MLNSKINALKPQNHQYCPTFLLFYFNGFDFNIVLNGKTIKRMYYGVKQSIVEHQKLLEDRSMILMLFVSKKEYGKSEQMLICSFRRFRVINRKGFQRVIFQNKMMKAVLALFLFGAANSCFIGNCFGGGGLCGLGGGCGLFGKPKPAPAPICQPAPQPQPAPMPQPKPQPQPQPQPPVCQQPPRPIPPTQVPNNPPISNPQPPIYNPQPPIYNPQPPIYNPQPPIFNPQPPINYPGFPQPPQILLPPIFPPGGYPNYPNYPQDPSFPNQPNFPQIPNNPYPPQRNDDYILTFDWAPRTNGINNLASSNGVVKIGNQIVADLSDNCGNDRVRHAEIGINLQNGENSISFEGTGKSDSYGVTVSNVVIRRRDSNQNLLVNGDFSSPRLAPGTWQCIRNGIKGWSADIAEVGDCKIYNNDWKSGQCIELDSTKNQIYTQKFTVSAVNRC